MSVFVRVTPSRLTLDGDDLYRVAVKLDSAARTAQSALSGTGGMAGNEESAQEFIDGYNDGAVNTLNAAGSYAQALRALDTLLGDTANAYADAGTIGTLEPVPSRSPSATPAAASTFSVPSAKAPGPEGPLGEFGEFVMDALAQIGVVLPDADTGKLSDAASAWSEFSTSISSAKSELEGTLTNLASMDIPQAENIRTSRDRIADKLDQIAKAAGTGEGLSFVCAEQQKAVDKMWEEIAWFLGQMAAEIAVDLGLGALLSIATGGLGAPAVVAKIAVTVMKWVIKIAELVKKLVTLTRMNAMAAKILLKALAEGTQSAIATVTVQAAVNVASPERAQNLLTVGLGSFAGGGISGRVGDGGAHVLRVGSRSGATRVAMNTALGAGEGAVDGLTDGLVQSGVGGVPFDPISSAGLGALIGGVTRPVGGGTRPGSPSTGGGNTSSPSTVDVPSASTPDSPTGPSGVDAPSAPDMNTPAGPQGSGGAPSSSAPAAGGGTSPDAPDAPIVDGAGEATTSVDSSTSVDIPAGDAPDGTGVDISSTADGPSIPDVSSPSSDGGTPSLPDSTPSTPDASTPDASTPDTTPSTPDTSTPSTPDTSAPSTPDSSTPSTPDASTPSTPDATPSTPDTSTPSTPDATPSTPDTSAPSTPDASTPDTSTPDTTPSTPDSAPADGSPSSAPVAGAAAAGGASAAPSTSIPDANTSVDTSAFESAVAADAATPDAETPDSNTPESDAANTDQTVDPDALDAGDAAAAGAVAAGAAGVVGLHAGASGGKAPSTPSSPTGPASPATPSAPSSNAPSSPTSKTPSSPTPDANTPAAPGTPDATSPDANTPDVPETPEGSNSTERTTAEIDTALAEINPNFDPFDPANGYATNCGNTSAILNDFLNGNPTSEAPTGTLGVPEMEARTGNPQTRMSPEQIADSLREMGAGSHCVVGIDRSTGDGHWFNAYFDGDTVWSIDAQTGTRSAWPPNEPNATNWDASIRPEDVADPKAPEAETPASGSSSSASSPDSTTPFSPAGTSNPPATVPAPDASTPDTSTPDTSTPDTPSANDRSGATPDTPEADAPRYDQSIVDSLSPESQAILADATAEARPLTDLELDALNADPAMRDAVAANSDVRRRVTLRVRVKLDIIADADRNSDGDLLGEPDGTVIPCRRYPDNTPMRFDPATGLRVERGQPGITMPEPGSFDFGHAPGHQWRDTRITATLENGWDRPAVIEYENTPEHFRIEHPSDNRSNRNNRRP